VPRFRRWKHIAGLDRIVAWADLDSIAPARRVHSRRKPPQRRDGERIDDAHQARTAPDAAVRWAAVTTSSGIPADDPFAREFTENAAYAEQFSLAGLEPVAARGLAVLTCMDSRIEPLQMLGLRPGDATIMRNAGARVTDDVLRALVVAVHLLGVRRVLVVPHLGCRMSAEDEAHIHGAISAASGVDTRSLSLQPAPDVSAALRYDVQRIRSWPYLPRGLAVEGAVYDVETGRLERSM